MKPVARIERGDSPVPPLQKKEYLSCGCMLTLEHFSTTGEVVIDSSTSFFPRRPCVLLINVRRASSRWGVGCEQFFDSIRSVYAVWVCLDVPMTEAGWDSETETGIANLETALNQALQINSPSKRVKAAGVGTPEGIGLGMTEYRVPSDGSGV